MKLLYFAIIAIYALRSARHLNAAQCYQEAPNDMLCVKLGRCRSQQDCNESSLALSIDVFESSDTFITGNYTCYKKSCLAMIPYDFYIYVNGGECTDGDRCSRSFENSVNVFELNRPRNITPAEVFVPNIKPQSLLSDAEQACATNVLSPGEQAWSSWHVNNAHSMELEKKGYKDYVQAVQDKHNFLSCISTALHENKTDVISYVSALPQLSQIVDHNVFSKVISDLEYNKWSPLMPSVTRYQQYDIKGVSGTIKVAVLLSDVLCDTVTDNSCMTGVLAYGNPDGNVTQNTGESIVETFVGSADFLLKKVDLRPPISVSALSYYAPQLSATSTSYNTTFNGSSTLGNSYYVSAQYGIDWAKDVYLSMPNTTTLNTTAGKLNIAQRHFVTRVPECKPRTMVIHQNYINDLLGSPSLLVDKVGRDICLLTNGTTNEGFYPLCPVMFDNPEMCANILSDENVYDNCGSAERIILRGAFFNESSYIELDSDACEISSIECNQQGANSTQCSEMNIPVVNQGVIYVASAGDFAQYINHDNTTKITMEPWSTIRRLGLKPYAGDGVFCDTDEAMLKLLAECLDECYTNLFDGLSSTSSCDYRGVIHNTTLGSEACTNLIYNYAGFTQIVGAGITHPINGAVAGVQSGSGVFNKDVAPITVAGAKFGILSNNTPHSSLRTILAQNENPSISYQLTNETCVINLQNIAGDAFANSGRNVNVPTVQGIFQVVTKLYASNYFSGDSAMKSQLYAQSQQANPDTSLSTIFLAVAAAVGTIAGYNVDNMRSGLTAIIGQRRSKPTLFSASIVVHTLVTSVALAPSIAIIYDQIKAKNTQYSVINYSTTNNGIPLSPVNMQTHIVQVATYFHQPDYYVFSLVLSSITIFVLIVWAIVQAFKLSNLLLHKSP